MQRILTFSLIFGAPLAIIERIGRDVIVKGVNNITTIFTESTGCKMSQFEFPLRPRNF